MNILTITAIDSSSGGASRVAMDLHQAYLARGITSHVMAGKKTSTAEDVTEIRRPTWRKALSYLLANDFDFFDGKQILRSKAFRSADIVHCHNLNGWYFHLPTLRQISSIKPLVWTLHDMWAITPRSAHSSSEVVRNGLYELSDPGFYPTTLWNNDAHLGGRKVKALHGVDLHVVTPCRWLSDKVAKSHLADRARSVIYNGIDTATFVPTGRMAGRAELGAANTPVIMFVGAANNPTKGYAEFKRMASSLNGNALFAVVGSETDRVAGNLVEIAKTSDKGRMASLLSAADVVVMPSKFEVFPLLMLEALACGTPVVGYDAGGMKELLGRVPGCSVVSYGDEAGLQAAVASAISRPSREREALAIPLRETVVREYSLRQMAEQYLQLYASLIGSRNGAVSK